MDENIYCFIKIATIDPLPTLLYLKTTYILPIKMNENWELFPAKKQSLENDKILLSIHQIAVNIVSQWRIKM